jgi:hypothetical protein
MALIVEKEEEPVLQNGAADGPSIVVPYQLRRLVGQL